MDPTASNNTILEETKKPPFAEVLQLKIKQRWQTLLDRMAPQLVLRWIVLAILFGIYFVRVYYLQGFYIITYALGIFMLNLFIGFLSPVHDVDGDGPMLPVNDADEFKPFVRRLPEFKFWLACTKAVILAFWATFLSVFNVPVFWPILLIYFCVLTVLTLKRQVQHMRKHMYLPFTTGKKIYAASKKDAVEEDVRSK